MIRPCTDNDIPAIDLIINEAAAVYRGAIPDDCWHEPYMSRAELLAELAAGVKFCGWEERGVLLGVMGVQDVREVTLIRHAYVKPAQQGRGIGGALLKTLTDQAAQPILIGTWATATWAIGFYRKHGFEVAEPQETLRLLEKYWRISPRQRETSVVLYRRGAMKQLLD